jgi:hypothetical protein
MKKIFLLLTVAALTFSACSDDYMNELNNDPTKTSSMDPNSQLTTCLLQTYGDFQMMDTYRCYLSGFTQHFAGNWNIVSYAGCVFADDDMMRQIWDRLYPIAINNLTDAINKSADKPNINAMLRIHKVYLMSILTDIYGDVPCSQAGRAIEGISNPKYDTQEEIYNWIFEELKACVAQLGTGSDHITGDVTSLNGSTDAWRKYANSLRMRYAMRISEVNSDKARAEFEAAVADGAIESAADDAYIKYLNASITKYDGARDYDFRYNALGAIMYGQDIDQPMFVSSTLYEILSNLGDPRLYRICRHCVNAKRDANKPDYNGTVDLTKEMRDYLASKGLSEVPCDPGQSWYDNWKDIPDVNDPNLEKLKSLTIQYPDAAFDADGSLERLLRLWLSIDFEMPTCPGTLINYAEVELLKAEALVKEWTVDGSSAEDHFKKGVKASMVWMNTHYLGTNDKMSETEMNNYVNSLSLGSTKEQAKEAINTQAWILHMMNPVEAWSNLRRSDYPVIKDRTQLPQYGGYTYGNDLSTPARLRYPNFENQYNSVKYNEALERMGGKDDWHHRVWWDKDDYHVQ